MVSLASRVALVTGSTSGIGYSVARALASKGVTIVLTGFGDEGVIKDCQESIKNDFNVPVSYVAADLSDQAQVRHLAQTVIEKHPPGVDILFNNAGFVHVDHVERFPDEVWDRLLAVMLTAPFLLTKYLLPGMRCKVWSITAGKQTFHKAAALWNKLPFKIRSNFLDMSLHGFEGWGRIINMSSSHGIVGTAGKVGYCAAKHGLMGLTKTVAMDIADTGITCNSINPGCVDTEIYWKFVNQLVQDKGITKEKAELELLAKQPMKKSTTVEQIGEAALFLCSPAADNMTGTSIVMDGGWTAT